MTLEPWTLLIVVLAIATAAAVALQRFSQRRHAELKQRFGLEYDRAVAEYGSTAKADRALRARKKRVRQQKLRALSETDRVRFSSEWRKAQVRFVDDPFGAVRAANELIDQLMRARGYSDVPLDQRIEDLTVDHARVIQNYRAARTLTEANRDGGFDTEELRQAFVHYRALFADLLETPRPAPQLQEANA